MEKILMFAWRRWTLAERRLSAAPGRAKGRRVLEKACEFWRTIHNRAEAVLEGVARPQRIAHAAVARTGGYYTFTRPPTTDLPETMPDLPVVNVGVMLRSHSRGRRV